MTSASKPAQQGEMAMLPNGYHPGNRCSCRECLERYPSMPSGRAETKAGHTPATPLPWRANTGDGCIESADGKIIFYIAGHTLLPRTKADVEYMLHACNTHPALCDLLTDLLDDLEKRSDVNHNGDGPNWAMSRAQEVRECLRKAGRVVE